LRQDYGCSQHIAGRRFYVLDRQLSVIQMMQVPEILKRCSIRRLSYVVSVCTYIGFLWATGAIYYLSYLPPVVRMFLAMAYFVTGVVAFFRIQQKQMWLQRIGASLVAVYILTLAERPSHHREWATDNAIMPNVEIKGDNVVISGFRHTTYLSETEFEINYRTIRFRVSQIRDVCFVVQRFTTLGRYRPQLSDVSRRWSRRHSVFQRVR